MLSRPDGNLLNLVQVLSNGETFLPRQSLWHQYFVTDLPGAEQECITGTIEFENEVEAVRYPTIQLHIVDVEKL